MAKDNVLKVARELDRYAHSHWHMDCDLPGQSSDYVSTPVTCPNCYLRQIAARLRAIEKAK